MSHRDWGDLRGKGVGMKRTPLATTLAIGTIGSGEPEAGRFLPAVGSKPWSSRSAEREAEIL